MPKKKSNPVTLLQIINEPRDKRTRKSVKRVADSLFDNFKSSEIANTDAFNGLSYQRISSIKKKINSGDLYSPELRDLLNEALEELKNNDYKETKEGMKIFYNDKALIEHQKAISKDWKIASLMKQNIKQAKKWWEEVGAGAEYFAVLRRRWKLDENKYIYFVVDIDPHRESRNKTTRKGKKINEYETKRAKQLEDNFLKESTGLTRKDKKNE